MSNGIYKQLSEVAALGHEMRLAKGFWTCSRCGAMAVALEGGLVGQATTDACSFAVADGAVEAARMREYRKRVRKLWEATDKAARVEFFRSLNLQSLREALKTSPTLEERAFAVFAVEGMDQWEREDFLRAVGSPKWLSEG